MLRHDDVAFDDDFNPHRQAATGGVTSSMDRTSVTSLTPAPTVPSIHRNRDGWEALAAAVFSHPGRPLADLRDRARPDAPVAPVIDLEGHRRRRSEGR